MIQNGWVSFNGAWTKFCLACCHFRKQFHALVKSMHSVWKEQKVSSKSSFGNWPHWPQRLLRPISFKWPLWPQRPMKMRHFWIFFQTLWCGPTSKLLNSLASDPLKSWVSCWHFWNGKSMMKMSFASALEELEWFFDFPFSWMKTSASAARFCTARTTMQNSISADAPFSPVVLFTKRFCLWFIACFWRRVFFHWKERRTKINCFKNFFGLGGQSQLMTWPLWTRRPISINIGLCDLEANIN